jgi:hypothetical protein
MSQPRDLTDGEAVIEWAKNWCVSGSGPARLTVAQRALIYRLFDAHEQLTEDEIAASGVAPYLVLYCLCHPRTRPGAHFRTNIFALWACASAELRVHLRRRGDRVDCPGVGTHWLPPHEGFPDEGLSKCSP